MFVRVGGGVAGGLGDVDGCVNLNLSVCVFVWVERSKERLRSQQQVLTNISSPLCVTLSIHPIG